MIAHSYEVLAGFSQSSPEIGMSVEEKLEPHKHDKKASECMPYGVHAAT